MELLLDFVIHTVPVRNDIDDVASSDRDGRRLQLLANCANRIYNIIMAERSRNNVSMQKLRDVC